VVEFFELVVGATSSEDCLVYARSKLRYAILRPNYKTVSLENVWKTKQAGLEEQHSLCGSDYQLM